MRKNTATFAGLFQRHSARLRHLAEEGLCPDPQLASAARVILLLGEGLSTQEVAVMCGLSQTRVRTLRHRFMLLGLAGLQPAAPVLKQRKPGLPTPGAGSARTPEPTVTFTITSVRHEEPGAERHTGDTMEGDLLAEVNERLCRTPLPPHQRLRLLALKLATDRRLTFTAVAKKAGVTTTTLTRWWKVARHHGVTAVLEIPRPPHMRESRFGTMKTRETTEAALLHLPDMTRPWASLLSKAGVASVAQLADQVPAKLHRGLEEVNREERIATALPVIGQLEAWVRGAKRAKA